jgi:hypothetical protein
MFRRCWTRDVSRFCRCVRVVKWEVSLALKSVQLEAPPQLVGRGVFGRRDRLEVPSIRTGSIDFSTQSCSNYVMYFLDPFRLTCPNCRPAFQRPANWLRRPGRKCPHCRGSLGSLRLELESQCEEWDTFVGDVDRVIAAEHEFKVAFDERDAPRMRTFADAHRLVIERLAAAGRKDRDPASVWARLVAAMTRVPEYQPSATPLPADRFIRSPLLLSDPTRTGGNDS